MGERVVLLRDERWTAGPGVCCWRHSLRTAFTAAGATVAEESWLATTPPAASWTPPGRPASGASGRAAWLPASVRTPLVKALRRSRRLATTAIRDNQPRRPAPVRPLPPTVTGADLVIAESLEVAADLRDRVPAQRVWVLALPPEWLPAPASVTFAPLGTSGPAAVFAERVAEAGSWVGGMLTDSELARSSLERAASRTRVRVLLFPPLARDAACPTCAGAQPVQAADLPAQQGDPQEALRLTPPAAGAPVDGPHQLATWRWLRDAGEVELPYSFVHARWLGLSAPVAPAARWDWPHTTTVSPVEPLTHAPAEDWSTRRQQTTATAVLAAARPITPATPRPRRRALITGYDLKFARELGDELAKRTDLAVTLDDWSDVDKPSRHTDRLLADAQAIFAEWARPNAARISRTKRPDQLLIVRLHRFEMESPYPAQIDISNVDAVVYIAPLFGRRIRDELGWPAEKLVYIPNYIDLDWFDRPKLPGAQFTLGMVGIHGLIKRLDLALDILRDVRQADNRFTLRIRSDMPWDNKYHWAKTEEREYAGWWAERIDNDPLLRGAVVFDRPGRDMARWYRQIGHMLSPSDFEGSHASITEGMASGAVPVVRPWPGADELYAAPWVHPTRDDAVAAILASADEPTWLGRSAAARAEITQTHDHRSVVEAWADLLHGDLPAAKTHFARLVQGRSPY